MRRIVFTLIAGGMAMAALLAVARAEPRAVIELFTSQGCSSCPPADKLLAEYAKDPNVIALSLAVDYWDYLGWKDTLALPVHAKRQQAYARSRGDREVYTPQVVVNGVAHALGSNRSAIEQAIAQTHRSTSALSLPIDASVKSGKLTVSVGAGKDSTAEVWACVFAKVKPVMIERGENRGQTITYHNVVRYWAKLGTWTGKAESYAMPLPDMAGEAGTNGRVAVVVQSGAHASPGVILGAATADLH